LKSATGVNSITPAVTVTVPFNVGIVTSPLVISIPSILITVNVSPSTSLSKSNGVKVTDVPSSIV